MGEGARQAISRISLSISRLTGSGLNPRMLFLVRMASKTSTCGSS